MSMWAFEGPKVCVRTDRGWRLESAAASWVRCRVGGDFVAGSRMVF